MANKPNTIEYDFEEVSIRAADCPSEVYAELCAVSHDPDDCEIEALLSGVASVDYYDEWIDDPDVDFIKEPRGLSAAAERFLRHALHTQQIEAIREACCGDSYCDHSASVAEYRYKLARDEAAAAHFDAIGGAA